MDEFLRSEKEELQENNRTLAEQRNEIKALRIFLQKLDQQNKETKNILSSRMNTDFETKPYQQMQIFIKAYDGKTHAIDVNRNDTLF